MAFMATALLASCSDKGDDHSGDFGQIKVPDTRQLEQTVTADDTQAAQGVTFTTEGAWTSSIAETRAGAPSWITISPDHGDAAGSYTLKITLQPNDSKESRTAKIVITCGTSKIEITVTQEGTGESGGDDDEPSVRQPNGRLAKITLKTNGKADGVITIGYDTEGRIVSYKDTDADGSPYNDISMVYTSNSKMLLTQTYYDKGTPETYEVECTGTFTSGFSRIDYATETRQGQTRYLEYTYDNNEYLIKATEQYGSEYEAITRYAYEDTGLPGAQNLTGITWGIDSQTFQYNEKDPQTDRTNDTNIRLFNAYNKGQGIAPELLLVEEPNELLALGFNGRQSRFMPGHVKSSFSGTEYRQEVAYKYTVPADWKIGEQIDGMTIIVETQEGGFSTTQEAVLTFDGI